MKSKAPAYPCQKDSSAPLILRALKEADKFSKWVKIDYQYKRGSLSVKSTALHYSKKFPEYTFVGSVSTGKIWLRSDKW